jgi:hypothetical protein
LILSVPVAPVPVLVVEAPPQAVNINARATTATVFINLIGPPFYHSDTRRLRNARSRINTAFFWLQNKTTPHWFMVKLSCRKTINHFFVVKATKKATTSVITFFFASNINVYFKVLPSLNPPPIIDKI